MVWEFVIVEVIVLATAEALSQIRRATTVDRQTCRGQLRTGCQTLPRRCSQVETRQKMRRTAVLIATRRLQ